MNFQVMITLTNGKWQWFDVVYQIIYSLYHKVYIEIMERFRGNIRGLPDSLNDRPINEVQAVLHDSRVDFGTYYKKNFH